MKYETYEVEKLTKKTYSNISAKYGEVLAGKFLSSLKARFMAKQLSAYNLMCYSITKSDVISIKNNLI